MAYSLYDADGMPTLKMYPQIVRYVAIEVSVSGTGQINFPDQSQLRGAYVTSVTVETPDVAAVSAVTGQANIATLADLQNMTLSLVRGSNSFVNNKPILALNPYQMPSGNTPAITMRELFIPQIVDWNQCYLKMNAAPSAATVIVSIGVYYFWLNNKQPNQ